MGLADGMAWEKEHGYIKPKTKVQKLHLYRQHKISLKKTTVWEGTSETEAHFQERDDNMKYAEDFFMYRWVLEYL